MVSRRACERSEAKWKKVCRLRETKAHVQKSNIESSRRRPPVTPKYSARRRNFSNSGGVLCPTQRALRAKSARPQELAPSLQSQRTIMKFARCDRAKTSHQQHRAITPAHSYTFFALALHTPMRRLASKTVFLGLVVSWFLAASPTRRSPSSVKAT